MVKTASSALRDAGEARALLPLVIDLDGTLLLGDLLFEVAAQYIRSNPFNIFLLFWWLLGGVAHLKFQLAARVVPVVDHAPCNIALVDHARAAKSQGRRVFLATASPDIWAHIVAARFPFIDEVLASCSKVNLKGRRKADLLEQRFGRDFVYAGNAKCDLYIWSRSRRAIFAGQDTALKNRFHSLKGIDVEADFSRPKAALKDWLRNFRLHQWAKNLLIFVPIFLTGQIWNLADWAVATVGFIAMGLTASATYIVNDIFDIADDRRHWKKRHRPIAAGLISIPQAASAATLMMIGAFAAIGAAAGWGAMLVLAIYVLASLAYSFGVKRIPVVDVFVLAGLFTLRLVFGAGLIHAVISDWLLVFSMLIFGSLAFAKRVTELARHEQINGCDEQPSGRGYVLKDMVVVTGLGTAAAVAAPVMMSLYLINEAFSVDIYHHPKFLWCIPLVIGLWLGRMWLLCGRGELADDPVSFALKDKVSLSLGVLVCLSMTLAIAPWR